MSTKKRKRSTKPQSKIRIPSKEKVLQADDDNDDEVGFTATLSDDDDQQVDNDDEEQEVHETPDEKRLRLAKEYLKQIQDNNDTQDTDLIASRLKDEAVCC